MSPHWLKYLEKFGARVPSGAIYLEPEDLEEGITDPRMYKRYDVLFHLFGPLPDSAWVPYHCPTLFASIDKLNIEPKEIQLSPGYHKEHPPGSWQWVGSDTMVIIDLPGPGTIEVGVTLMKQGAQLISTFDHWALSAQRRWANVAVDSAKLIDTMFTLAPEVYELRKALSSDAAPVWMCDDQRLGNGGLRPRPGTFDNRYYIDDSILPGLETLKKAGIRHIVHLSMKLNDQPNPDLTPFLIEAHEAGMALRKVALGDEATWAQPQPMDKPFKTTIPLLGFRRSDMGGFGKMVPEASEGGYSSGGGGG